jgi:hypothetical protein
MRRFKSITKTVSFLAICFICVFFVSAESGEPMDIVVLFDMSRASIEHFEETREYITGAFLKEFVRKGDTFHLISFGEMPRIEISRRIEGEGDYRTIIGRLLLLYPIVQSASVEKAVGYAQAFAGELPPGRQKKVVLFTAESGLSAAELGAPFTPAAQFYLASIPASFGTLNSGRPMLKTPPAPPVPAAIAPVLPSPPAVPAAPLVTSVPAEPPVLPVSDGRAEPRPYNAQKAAAIVLLFAALLLAGVLVAGGLLCRKTRRYGKPAGIDEFLRRFYADAAAKTGEHIAGDMVGRGLLRKASAIKEQTA